MNKEIWKQLPNYPFIEVSNFGKVRGPKGRRDLTVTEYDFREWDTSKGSYLTCTIFYMGPKGLLSHDRTVHVLVAETYIKKTPEQETLGDKLTVNHIDGDKHNNKVDNLEWATRSEQLLHAYETGLRNDNVRVKVYDRLTEEVVEYYSLAETARQFEVSASRLNTIIENSRRIPYKDRYTFELDVSNRVTPSHDWINVIHAINYKNGELHVADNARDISIITGINHGTVQWHLRNETNALINGWVIRFAGDESEWPKFTKEEAMVSETNYNERSPSRERKFGIKVVDYVKKETRTYGTLTEASKGEEVSKTTITIMIHMDEPKLLMGKVFRHAEDNSEPPHFEEHVIIASTKRSKITYEVYKLTDLKTNVISFSPTIREAALEIGENPVSLAGSYRNRPHVPFKQRWMIERVY